MNYFARRVLLIGPSLICITLVAFLLGALAPGDPAREIYLLRYGELPSDAAALQALRHEIGLDQPLPLQYARWLVQVLQGDLGISWRHGLPVAALLAQATPTTLLLALPGALLATLIGLVIGLATAARPGGLPDRALALFCTVTSSVPAFFVAYLLMYLLAIRCHWLPALGTGGLRHLWLPWFTLALTGFQSLARLTRASIAEALHSPWIWTARAKGLAESVVLLRHALSTRLAALLTGVGNTIAATLGRAVIVEVVFGWPGLGRLATDSVVFRDTPAIQGFTLLFGALVLLLYLAVDLLAAQVDPRMRPSRSGGGQ